MNLFTISFFGYRQMEYPFIIEKRLERLISTFLQKEEYVVFLVGRNGEFNQLVSSVMRKCKKAIRNDNSALVLVLPYMTAEYRHNIKSYHQYYDEVEICANSSGAYFKSAHQIRNYDTVDRSDFMIFYVKHCFGGADQTLLYADKVKAKYMNLQKQTDFMMR